MRYKLTKEYNKFHITIHLKNEQGQVIFTSSGGNRCVELHHDVGEYEQICIIPANFLNCGTFAVDLYAVVDCHHSFARDHDIITFTVAGLAKEIGTFMEKEPGDITPLFDYTETKLK